MGTKWATEKRSAVLEVPSVIIPSELNFLLNPEHPDFSKIEIGNPKPVGWDQRLLALLNKNPKGLEDMPPFLTAGVRLTRPWHLPLAALPTIPVIDPTNPRARNMLAMSSRYGSTQLPGDYVAIAYGTDPASAYKSAIAQRNQKMSHPVPAIDIASVKEIPSSISGAREYILQGDFDARDGQGSKAQLVMSQPFGPTGGWQMIVYQAVIPVNLVAEESATAGAIMRSYNINSQIIRGEARAQIGAIQNLAAIVQERSRRSEADTDFSGGSSGNHQLPFDAV
jgi:hypothetical protein